MRRTISTWVGWLGLVGLLAGCAATPVRYYSLAAPATDRPVSGASGAAGQGGLSLSVTRIPAEAERPQLVVRDPARAPAVQVLNDSLWVASLGDEIQAALAAGLSRRLGTVQTRRLPAEQAQSVRHIEVRIERFDLIWGRFAALDADWTDRAPGASQPRLCRASVRLPAAESVAALVEAQRQALDRLAALIAAEVSGAPADLQERSSLSESGCT